MRDERIVIRVLNGLGILCTAAAIVAGLYIMARGLGLVDSLEFGAGAYYYADMPGFERLVRWNAYRSGVPAWVIGALFFAWGWAVYRLWVWLDKR